MGKSQFAAPFIVTEEGASTVLKRVSFESTTGGFSYNEKWLQELLFTNGHSLPISEIDTAFQDIVPICTELNTPAGPIDILYATPQGKLVLLEAKLWRNPEARRKVIAQILDYAKELNRWDYEELQKQVSRRLNNPGRSLFEHVRDVHPEIDEAKFIDQVSQSLRTGRFMLLIVGDGIREGAGSIAQFLDEVGYLGFTLGLVEVGIYEMPQQGTLIQPRVLAKTITINRTVIELASDNIQVASNEEITSKEDTEPFYRIFWTELLKHLVLDDSRQAISKPPKGKGLWFELPPFRSNAWINAYFAPSAQEVGVYFRLGRNDFGELAYNELTTEKATILNELPDSASWYTNNQGFRTVSITMKFHDVLDDGNQEAITAFFISNINAFVNTFRKRMEKIVEDLNR